MQPHRHIVVTELGPDTPERVTVEPLPPYFTDRPAGSVRQANDVQAFVANLGFDFCTCCGNLKPVVAGLCALCRGPRP